MSPAYRHVWKRQGLFLLAAFVAGVFLWGIWPQVESRLFPVTSLIRIMPSSDAPYGTQFTFEYEKYRDCKLLSVDASKDGHWVAFFPLYTSARDSSKPVGHNASSSPWILLVNDLDGVEISFMHRCPLEPWAVTTHVFP